MIGALISCTALRADMVPVASTVDGLVSQGLCVVPDSVAADWCCPLVFWDGLDLALLTPDLSLEGGSGLEQASEVEPVRMLSDGQSSLALCLFALVGLGMFRSVPWVRKASVAVIPDWYQSAGPGQIGHSTAITPDCWPVPVCGLVKLHHGRSGYPSAESEGTVVSLWRNTQYTSAVLASRGPPLVLGRISLL